MESRIDEYHQQLIEQQKGKPFARVFPVGRAVPEPADEPAREEESEVQAKVVRSRRRKGPATTEAETK